MRNGSFIELGITQTEIEDGTPMTEHSEADILANTKIENHMVFAVTGLYVGEWSGGKFVGKPISDHRSVRALMMGMQVVAGAAIADAGRKYPVGILWLDICLCASRIFGIVGPGRYNWSA